MAGLYLHIPYCRQACVYCNFHFSTRLENMGNMIAAMVTEMSARQGEMDELPETVYLGGGTPSVLPLRDLSDLFQGIRRYFNVDNAKEITLEANPEDITPDNTALWLKLGINRLSIGIQSIQERELKAMNRNHTLEQSLEAVENSLKAGFGSVNIDLIYGSPWLETKKWKETLDWAFDSGADHISAYALTIEPKTALSHSIRKGLIASPAEEHQAQHYEMLCKKADAEAWDFYEISNLALPGKRALHNSNYWKNKPYVGIGPGAHSYSRGIRRWNMANNAGYIKNINEDKAVHEAEILTAENMCNEMVMTRLRQKEGLNLDELTHFGVADIGKMKTKLQNWAASGHAVQEGALFKLTIAGRLICDHISSELMI